MKVFLAGATGALGRRLVPLLVARGHEVVGMTRTASKATLLRELGAEPVVADGLDRAAVVEAVVRAEPEVVIHEMTSLAALRNMRRWDHEFALTNRLRTDGLDHLLEGARTSGARRFVAQGYANLCERTGGPVKTEDDPLDPHPPNTMARTLAALRHVETAVLAADDIEGVVLRYAGFYGPAHEMPGMVEAVRRGRMPIIGDGGGVWSFLHLDDAATATVLALEPEDRRERLANLLGRILVERVVLGLDRPAGPRGGPAGVALRDEVLDARLAGRLEQVVGALGAEAVGGGEGALEAPQVEVAAERGHLVDDRVGARGGHRGADAVAVEAVDHHRLGAEPAQQVGLRRAAGGAGDGVAVAGEEGDERLSCGAGRPGEKDLHAPPTRRRARL